MTTTGFPPAPPAPISMERPGVVTLFATLHFISAIVLLLVPLTAVSSFHDLDPFGAIAAGFFLLWGLFNLITGLGLWFMREPGRILQIISSGFGLLFFPIGTMIAIFLLIYFTKPGTKILFSRKPLHELTAEEADAVRASAASSGIALALGALAGLGALAAAGILASIFVPNVITATQIAKQRRTMAEMSSVEAEVESYRASHHALPQTVTPRSDAWDHPLRYAHDADNYWIISAGKDGVFETDTPQEYGSAVTRNFDTDLVIRNGEWLRGESRRAHAFQRWP